MKKDTAGSADRGGRCCKNCVWEMMRCVLLLLNAVMFVFGSMVLSTGIYLIVSGNNLSTVTGTSTFSGAAVLIVGGTVVALVALIGVMAAASLSWQLLLTYNVILTLWIILEAVGVILAIAFQATLVEHMVQQTRGAISGYRLPTSSGYSRDDNNFIDFLQSNFTCCGVSGPEDWENTLYVNTTHSFPTSCACLLPTDTQTRCELVFSTTASASFLVWNQGCNQSITTLIGSYTNAFIGAGVGVAVIQIVSLVIAVMLCACIKHKTAKRKTLDISK